MAVLVPPPDPDGLNRPGTIEMSATATGTATTTTHQYFRGTFSSLATTSSYALA
jgi:hypothetical protein